MKNVALIIPCYNEADVLELLRTELYRVCNPLQNFDFEFVFVNDGSKDETLNIIKRFAETDKRCKFISFSRNFGKEAAMLAGMQYAVHADYIGIIDADLQHSPDLIPEMIEACEKEGYDVAAARRSDREGEEALKSALSGAFYKVINKVSEININDSAQDFRIMKQKVVQSILSMPERIRFSKGIFTWVGFNTKWFSHENRERAAGETKWSIRKLAKYALDGILGYTTSPLRLALWFGVLLCVVGVGVGIYAVVRRFVCDELLMQSFVTLYSVLFMLVGIVLAVIGILGEYLARVYTEIKGRPVYIISETNTK
ncbi:MAG: glycosyltransferase family 2 protein [Ruminococcaceae bacterium]|nr:glycosyltransferase family 2 protein [Oscillospiraceae bacterium]